MISQRLKEYFEYKGVSFYVVEKAIQVSTGCISGAVRHKRNLGSNILQRVLLVYPDLSAEWLFRGTGPMILTEQPEENEQLLKYQALSDHWLIDRMLNFFNFQSKNQLISFFERIHGEGNRYSGADSSFDQFEKMVLEAVEKRYGSTLANADELYAMYLQKIMREGENMLDEDNNENERENSM